MLQFAPQSPATPQGHSHSRIPLRPKNLPTPPPPSAKPSPIRPHHITHNNNNYHCYNKENNHHLLLPPHLLNNYNVPEEPLRIDASLADELCALREKLQRVQIDKDRTDQLLNERALTLDLQMKEILGRWAMQKQLEMELDRLYRLQEIKLASLRVCPLPSLRHKEEAKKMKLATYLH